jgi:hypothetical protein
LPGFSPPYTGVGGVGGTGGGGNGGAGSGNGSNGSVNTGGGGGGSGSQNLPSAHGAAGNGGSGIVILKYPDTFTATFSGGVTQSTASSGGFKISTITATSTTSETVTFA